MSLIPPSQVKVYCEQHGQGDQPEEVLTAIAQELEYRLRELVQDASKYMAHSKRTKLTVDDLNAALCERGQPRLYGYDPLEGLSFRAVPNTDLFYVPPGEEISLRDVLAEPLPRAPLPPALTCHALAIEGVQPAIPENPLQHGERVDLGPDPAQAQPQPPAGGKAGRRELQEEAEIRPLVKHVLSKELQLFYDTLITDLQGHEGKPEGAAAALKTLETDAGLQQLTPYLLQYIAEGVPRQLRSPAGLLVLMRTAGALLRNPYIFIEPYLHQLMPPVLTCLVGKRPSESANAGDPVPWSVRDEAAAIVAAVCTAYGAVYGNLVPRIAKTLTRALAEPDRPMSVAYGAVAGIAALGPQAIDSLLLPGALESILGQVQCQQQSPSAESPASHAERLAALLRQCVATWLAAYSGTESAVDGSPDGGIREKRALLERLFPDEAFLRPSQQDRMSID